MPKAPPITDINEYLYDPDAVQRAFHIAMVYTRDQIAAEQAHGELSAEDQASLDLAHELIQGDEERHSAGGYRRQPVRGG